MVIVLEGATKRDCGDGGAPRLPPEKANEPKAGAWRAKWRFSSAQHGAAAEGIAADGGDGSGEAELRDRLAPAEGETADGGEGVGQSELFQNNAAT